MTVTRSGYETISLPGQIVFSDRWLILRVRLLKIRPSHSNGTTLAHANVNA